VKQEEIARHVVGESKIGLQEGIARVVMYVSSPLSVPRSCLGLVYEYYIVFISWMTKTDLQKRTCKNGPRETTNIVRPRLVVCIKLFTSKTVSMYVSSPLSVPRSCLGLVYEH
jgi:hypothetical protein